MKNQKVVLAYSGGLDTSVCIRWLQERGWRVIAYCADVGQGENFRPVRERGLKCGAEKVIIQNLRKEFAREFILPSLQAGAIYQEKYLLATALSRPLIARGLAQAARQNGAIAVAHGCTGKGNDQVRIEVSLKIMNPRLQVLAPVRDWELTSRQAEIAYAKERRIPIPPKKKSRYSLDQNLWGVSIESGPLEDPWEPPPADCYQWTVDPAKAAARPEEVRVEFLQGVPIALNGRKLELVELIERLNKTGIRHGVGRSDMIEDRLVGIKSREIYEAPAAWVLHTALRELEQLTLDRETLAFKAAAAQRYARLVYDGLWFTELKAGLDAFTEQVMRRVTGTIQLRLFRGTCVPVGRKSPNSRYAKGLATYEGKDDFDQKAAAGFIQLFGLPYTPR
ncbi:MAG: argininosuccinate synthase [Candidatus Omnitrophica bacterium CG11_big_fil_rev_8_21_14_0_20_64_10]|nr:MAG: argininosuccinate synthase [Candidatus Omnitrophica bacterium CG11_big_fil_rev_8_21_14_0_20_64_10]